MPLAAPVMTATRPAAIAPAASGSIGSLSGEGWRDDDEGIVIEGKGGCNEYDSDSDTNAIGRIQEAALPMDNILETLNGDNRL